METEPTLTITLNHGQIVRILDAIQFAHDEVRVPNIAALNHVKWAIERAYADLDS